MLRILALVVGVISVFASFGWLFLYLLYIYSPKEPVNLSEIEFWQAFPRLFLIHAPDITQLIFWSWFVPLAFGIYLIVKSITGFRHR